MTGVEKFAETLMDKREDAGRVEHITAWQDNEIADRGTLVVDRGRSLADTVVTCEDAVL